MANLITLFRILLAIPVSLSIVNEHFALAFLLITIGAITDLLDGKIARSKGEEEGLGKSLDPLADKVFVLSILISLIEVERLNAMPVVLLTIRELSVSFLRSLVSSEGNSFGASVLGKAKTFFLFMAIFLLLGDYQAGTLLLWVAVVLAYVSFYDYARTYLKELSGLNYP